MIYFVTEERVKKFTPVFNNIDVNLISPLIPTNADMWFMPILGGFFYDHLLESYNNKTLNPHEVIVVDYIQKALIWRVVNDLSTHNTIQSTNKGEQHLNGDYSTIANMQQLGYKKTNYQAKAEFYENRLRGYLKREKSKYPQLTDKRNTDSCIVDVASNLETKGFTKVRFIK